MILEDRCTCFSRCILSNIILCCSPQLVLRDPLFHSNGDVERKQNGCGSVDCHAGAYFSKVDSLEETSHVMDAADRNSYPANFPCRPRMVRIEAELCWKVKRCAEPGLAVRYQILETPIGFLSRTKPRVLAHCPQPVPIHSIVDAPRIRELARPSH